MPSHEILENIKRLELRTRRLVDSFLSGEYFSVFKGRGLEFYEIRGYQFGDDVRNIDWKTTARLGEPYVKTYIEERELPVVFLVDVSGSMDFGSRGGLKRAHAIEIIAFLGMVAAKRSNPVGMAAFTDRVELLCSVKKGRKHLFDMLMNLASVRCGSKGTVLSVGLNALNHIVKRNSLVFFISDFPENSCELELKAYAKKYDIVPVVVSDPIEMEMPDVKFLELTDSETGERIIVDSGDKKFRDWFKGNANKCRRERERLFRGAGLDYIEAATDKPFTKPIRDFFYRRQSVRR